MTEPSGPPRPYDALLVVSFGGPEKPEDVMPFLRNVVAGRPVPEERLQDVARRYHRFGGRSPINEHNRRLVASLQQELGREGPALPVFLGNLHWHPMLADTLREMRDRGVRRAAAFVTSAFRSHASCRKYVDAIEAAQDELGAEAPHVDKLRPFYNHPGFIEAMADRVHHALEEFPADRREDVRLAFTAHSIPVAMAEPSEYVHDLEETCRLVAEQVDAPRWQLVYQSRSGPPSQPWLGPDVLDHLRALSDIGARDVVVVPVGFVSDHMEVIWDLDVKAAELAGDLGLRMARAGTAGTHPAFVRMVIELLGEHTGDAARRRALGSRGPAPAACAPGCCPPEPAGSVAAPGEMT